MCQIQAILKFGCDWQKFIQAIKKLDKTFKAVGFYYVTEWKVLKIILR